MSTTETKIVIARRFTGPRDSGNGGYSSGLIARASGLAAGGEVTLRAPPPLETPMIVAEGQDGTRSVRDGERLIAEARPRALELDVPAPVSFEQATEARERYHWRVEHPYPRCFVCGSERWPGDGLGVWPGAIADRRLVASAWVPDETLAIDPASGRIAPELVWAALDCPTWHGVYAFRQDELGPALLGRITARVDSTPRPGERCVVLGWEIGVEPRKVHGASAVFGEDGRCIARARGTWIRPA